jgi:hypothetical protein
VALRVNWGLAAPLALVLLTACVPAQRRPSWAIYSLQRSQPHDGLAVVSEPDGYGVHLWLATDTSQRGVCRPRWLVDPARLFNGNGSAPFSSGLAGRNEFFQAVGRWDVGRQLRHESEALCRLRAPSARFVWVAPPRNETEVVLEPLPPLKEKDLLPDPSKLKEEEQRLLGVPRER